MKMLTENEIYKLCRETEQKTTDYLNEYEKKNVERKSAFRKSQENRYLSALERYQNNLKNYEKALKTYEANVEREETEYPRRVEAWKKSEEQRKKSLEQWYEQAVRVYNRALEDYETRTEREETEYPKRVEAWEKNEEQRKRFIEQSYEQAVKKYENDLKKYEQEEIDYPERLKAWEESEEQRKNSIEERYQQAVKAYERALEDYNSKTEREEIDYPKRVSAWEENEEKRKQLIEQTYEQMVAAYEQSKKQYEMLGQPYNVPFPQKQKFFSSPMPAKYKYNKPTEPHKQEFFPKPKPVMHIYNKPAEPQKQKFIPNPMPVKNKYTKPTEPHKQKFTPYPMPVKNKFNKPVEPVAPKKPDEKQFSMNSDSMFSAIELMFTHSFSERAIRQLGKLNLSNSADRSKAFHIIFREMYLDKRTSMECSFSEGRGISPALDGLYGEKLTVFELELCIFGGYKGNILHNLEIEVGNRTVQVDVLFITQKGIFVIESKNYSGNISGAEYQNKWNLRTYRKNYDFYNPVAQNQTHINTLLKIIRSPRFFSLIAFSERCNLEYIDIHKKDVFVFNRYALRDVIYDIFSNEPDVLSQHEVKNISDTLRKYCADNLTNPNYKEPRSYYSAGSKASDDWK